MKIIDDILFLAIVIAIGTLVAACSPYHRYYQSDDSLQFRTPDDYFYYPTRNIIVREYL